MMKKQIKCTWQASRFNMRFPNKVIKDIARILQTERRKYDCLVCERKI